MDMNEVKWLASRIRDIENKNSPRWMATHRTIWSGCYDVWSCELDRIDAINIPVLRMQEAEENAYIKSEIKKFPKYEVKVYSLTELGETLLTQQ